MVTKRSRQAEERRFADLAEQRPPGLVREVIALLASNRKWWLLPIIAMLLLAGLIVVFGGTAAAPFIYTLF